MWEKSWERWRGWRENPQLLLGLVGIYTFCDIWMLEVGRKTVQDFHVLVTKCWRKKILLPINWGQIIRIQGSPKRAKRTGLNLQIHQKHSPGNWKVVIERQTGQTLHTATWNKCARTHAHTFTLQVSHAGKSTSVVFGRLHSTHASLSLPVTTGLNYHRHLN